jgi:hypothetical protein
MEDQKRDAIEQPDAESRKRQPHAAARMPLRS